MLVHLDLNAHLLQAVSGSGDMQIQDYARESQGLCRTRRHGLSEQPMNLCKAACVERFQLDAGVNFAMAGDTCCSC